MPGTLLSLQYCWQDEGVYRAPISPGDTFIPDQPEVVAHDVFGKEPASLKSGKSVKSGGINLDSAFPYL